MGASEIRYRFGGWSVRRNEYFADSYEDKYDKWDRLERDVDSCIRSIVETHKDNFGHDSYAVIDAIYQVMDQMFQKV